MWEWVDKLADIAHQLDALLYLVLAIVGAGTYLWKWGSETRKKDLRELVPAAVELVKDMAQIYKAARNGKSMPDKAKKFQQEFTRLAVERGYKPNAQELQFHTSMGSSLHKSEKRKSAEKEALALIEAIGGVDVTPLPPPATLGNLSGGLEPALSPSGPTVPPATTGDAVED